MSRKPMRKNCSGKSIRRGRSPAGTDRGGPGEKDGSKLMKAAARPAPLARPIRPPSMQQRCSARCKALIRDRRHRKFSSLDGSRCHIAFFTVLVDVEPLTLDLRCDPQADRGLYECAENRRPDHCECDRHKNRFQLLEPERVTDDSGQAILRRDNS